MEIFLATKITTPIIGQIASVMGWLMDGIYRFLNGLFGIQNIGLCIILFSIIIFMLMLPLQIKQQKFSKMSAVMQPEIQKIQAKYKGKKDQESMMRMNEETQVVYQKYGVSPTGSCLQLIIQMPILLALWQVIYRIPAYVSSVRAIFDGVVSNITSVEGFTDLVQTFMNDNKMARVRLLLEEGVATNNSIVDFLYALSPTQWTKLSEVSEFSQFSDTINNTASEISKLQNFLGLNIAETPWYYVKNVVAGGSILLAIVAVLIPILSWLTQVLNMKLMPQANQNDDGSSMANSMKTMNTVMPLMSLVFCFSFPVGLGIYWVISAVVRSVQQVLINKYLDKMDMDELINRNMKKIEEKRAKKGLPPSKITSQAHQNVRNIPVRTITKGTSGTDVDSRQKKVENAYNQASAARKGSITAKANMVRDFNERNKKK